MSEFKGVKWSLGGISGRMIQTNEYMGFVADVDTRKNAILISKAPEMLEALQKVLDTFYPIQDSKKESEQEEVLKQIEQLIKEATELK